MPKDAHTGPDRAARSEAAGADSAESAAAQERSGESADTAPSRRLASWMKGIAAPAIGGAAAGLAVGLAIGFGAESTAPADVEKAGARVQAEVSAQLEAFRGEVLDILDKRLRETLARAEDATALGDAARAAIRLEFRAALGTASARLAALADRLADAADLADQAAYETALADTLAEVETIAVRLDRVEERLAGGAVGVAISPRVLREILTEILALRELAAAHARRISEFGEAADSAAAPVRHDPPGSADAESGESPRTDSGGSADAAQPQARGARPETGAAGIADPRKREALEGIRAALDSGAGFAAELEALAALGVDVPEALASAREGVATVSALRREFPAAARAALAAVRAESPMGGEIGGVEGFLRKQFGVRSLRRREGGGTDAALSRAEAALAAGRLAEALAEIESLSAAVRGKMADWAGLARRRLEAIDAAAALGGRLD